VESPLCLHGSFQSYQTLFQRKIDVIITDPPYGREYLQLYESLATFAMETLYPGGWILCLTGWGMDWEIRRIFQEAGLEYITVCTYLIPGATLKGDRYTSTGKRNFQQQAKPLLWYQKPGSKLDRRRAGTSDLVRSQDPPVPIFVGNNQRNRGEFHWQQCVEGFKQIAWLFANPQDVICDPCMGSGTTLVAAYIQNRKHCIGIEQDAETFALAQQRVAKVEADDKAMPLCSVLAPNPIVC
jgi:site-specific DNA-methyltransferase (adenine-specific)